MTTSPLVVDRHESAWLMSTVWAWAAVAALAALAAGWHRGVLLAWVVPVAWAAVVDARSSRLPDRIVIVGVAICAVLLLVTGPWTGWSTFVGAVAGAAVLGVPFTLLHLASPSGFGFGDVKFGLLLGLGVGVLRPGLGIVVFCTAGVLQLLVAWCRPWPAQRLIGADRRTAPFGPALAIAAVGWVVVVLVSGGG